MAKSNRKRSLSKDVDDGPIKSTVNKKQKRSKTVISDDDTTAPANDDDKKRTRSIHSPQKRDKHSGRKPGRAHSQSPIKEQDERHIAATKDTAESSELLLKLKAVEAERAALQAKTELQEAKLSAQSDTISQLHSQCACTVCLELAYRPHVLSPCGHVFCARCLVLWFKKALPDEPPLAPYLTEEQRIEEQQRRTSRRKKLCPHCRERVQARPAEVWMIKGLVDKLDESIRSGQGNDKDTDLSNSTSSTNAEAKEARGENLKAGTALWDTIFPHNDKPYQHPIFDEDDHVYRCGMCASEIVNRACTNPYCAIEYSENELEEYDEEDSEFDINGLIYGGDFGVSEDEDWEDEDNDFIDDGPVEIDDDSEDEVEFDHQLHHRADDYDGNGDVELVAINGRNVQPLRRRRGRVIALSDSEEDQGDRRARSPSNENFSDREGGLMAGAGHHDDDDDDDDESERRSEHSYSEEGTYESESEDGVERDYDEEFDEGDPDDFDDDDDDGAEDLDFE